MSLRTAAILWLLFLLLVIALADQGRLGVLGYPARALPLGDKIGHFVLVGSAALMLGLAFSWRVIRWGPLPLLTSSLAIALFMGIEELSQVFLTRRAADPYDMAANLAGILVFDALARYLKARRVQGAAAGRPSPR